MKLTGEKLISQRRDVVWAALNDLDVLKASIPGCHEIEQVNDEEFALVIAIAVGPVKAKFKGKLLLSDIMPPDSYALTFQGTGGAVGFGKGLANVSLQDHDEGTLLNYGVEAQVGGKIAQVGARLISGVAAKMADEFFTSFEQCLDGDDDAGADAVADDEPTSDDQDAPGGARSRWKFWEKRKVALEESSAPLSAKAQRG